MRSLALAYALMVAACGGGGTNTDAGAGPAGDAGGSRLPGTWTYTSTSSTPLVSVAALEPDGSAHLTLSGVSGAGCDGNLKLQAFSWKATMTELTFSGTPTCAGGINCDIQGMMTTYACSTTPPPDGKPCPYALSNGGTTLETTNCYIDRGGTVQWTRKK